MEEGKKEEAIVDEGSLTWSCLCERAPVLGEVFDEQVGSIRMFRPLQVFTARRQVERLGPLRQKPALTVCWCMCGERVGMGRWAGGEVHSLFVTCSS